MRAYLVEVEPEAAEAGSVASRARAAAADARFLRSIYVPEDDRWFLLYEGATASAVAAAAEAAEVEVLSIAVARDLEREVAR